MEENIDFLKIVDASFVLSFLLPDGRQDISLKIFQRARDGKINFISSPILPFEVINGIKSAVKSKRTDRKTAFILIKGFLAIEIALPELNLAEIFELALKEDLSVYDASYLWLSQKENLPLLTLDTKMQKLAE